jgi:hypothetical protein
MYVFVCIYVCVACVYMCIKSLSTLHSYFNPLLEAERLRSYFLPTLRNAASSALQLNTLACFIAFRLSYRGKAPKLTPLYPKLPYK